MPSFTYAARETCLCGQTLDPTARRRVVRHQLGPVTFVHCGFCGSWAQSPQITSDSLRHWYDSDAYQGSVLQSGSAYEDYARDEPSRLLEADVRFMQDIRPWLPSGHRCRILEIGCASASLLARIRDRGHDIAGVDISIRFAEQARLCHQIDVQVSDILDAELPDSYFDAVLMFGTASNLADLPASLGKIHRLLRPGGLLILNHPSADSCIARLFGSSLWMFSPTVSNFCTRKGMRLCAEHQGFSLILSRMDWQRPSLGKLLRHSGLGGIAERCLPAAVRFRALPTRLPIPVVRISWFRRSPVAVEVVGTSSQA